MAMYKKVILHSQKTIRKGKKPSICLRVHLLVNSLINKKQNTLDLMCSNHFSLACLMYVMFNSRFPCDKHA